MTLEEAEKRTEEARAYLHIDEKTAELANLDSQIASPDFWNDTDNAQLVSKQASDIRDVIERYESACGWLVTSKPQPSLPRKPPEFGEEIECDLERLEKMFDDFEVESWFNGRFDSSDAILSIHPGSGGLEAQDWTEMLYRMYSRYADSKGWKVKILDLVPGEGIGLDRASIQIEGRNAYGMLRSESGVHRLVRISPTDDKKRRHTTFAAVEVIPVLPDNDISVEIDPNDVALMCTEQVAPAVSASTLPTPLFVSLIFLQVLWLPVRTRSPSSRTRKQLSGFYVVACTNSRKRSVKLNLPS